MPKRTFFEDTKLVNVPTTAGAPKWQLLLDITGSGENLAIVLFCELKTLRFQIFFDGILMPWGGGEKWIDMSFANEELFENSREGFCLSKYDDVNDFYTLILTLPIKWERELKVECRNTSIGATNAAVAITYDREVLPLPEPPVDIQEPGAVDPLM